MVEPTSEHPTQIDQLSASLRNDINNQINVAGFEQETVDLLSQAPPLLPKVEVTPDAVSRIIRSLTAKPPNT
jgi:hypothetical protein